MKYVDVVIENNSDNTDVLYSYKCEIPNISVGDMVYVSFARSKKKRKAYVFKVHDEIPDSLKNIKNIKSVEDVEKELSLHTSDIQLVKWMKQRYFCRYMDAINCFTPSGKPLKSGKKRELKWGQEEGKYIKPVLNPEQIEALNKVTPQVEKNKYGTFLLHGITGSGKTEVYMEITEKCLSTGKKVIMLVPEISLTHQTIERFVSRFGKQRIAVLHSKLSLGERYDQWISIKNGEVDIVIGARSAVFAPFENIGAIIVDEEHETTYKSDMTPKYDTIEVAIKRAIGRNAIVVLGSATPSVVSNYRAQTGLYKKLELKERYNQVALPKIHVEDMRQEMMDGNKTIFSKRLYEDINRVIQEDKQVILFLNRRGYSPFISCRMCGYVMKCNDCNISMTYHKSDNEAVCHFCGKKEKIPDKCPSCGSKYLKHFGTGTEKVEEITTEIFPDVPIARLDMDTTSKKGSGNKILKDFKNGKTKILIGTQMIAKGLDFRNVGLVGIIAADTSLNIPDFRSAERTFQLITQVAGRSGRGDSLGEVVIQTYMPENYSIICSSKHDYAKFYDIEILLRKTLFYPPFSDLLQVTVLSENQKKALHGAERVKNDIVSQLETDESMNILGPNSAPIAKMKEEYRYRIYIKTTNKSRKKYEIILSRLKKTINSDKKNGFRVIIEVNPFSLY